MESPRPRRPDPAPERFRYERKFHVTDLTFRQVELLVRLHPAHFRTAYPPRFINNIYFDTPALSDFVRHESGAENRSKIRLRWYGGERGRIEKPVLELKAKRGAVMHKPSLSLDPIFFDGRIDHESVKDSARRRNADPAMTERLACSPPALFNRYQRRYFISADNRFRLTLDTDLTFRTAGVRFCGSRTRVEVPHWVIVELKYDPQYDGLARKISDVFPFRLGKLSKYVSGILHLSGWRE